MRTPRPEECRTPPSWLGGVRRPSSRRTARPTSTGRTTATPSARTRGSRCSASRPTAFASKESRNACCDRTSCGRGGSSRRPSPAGATQLPPLLLGQRLRQRRVRGGTRHRVVADRTVHEGPRTGPDEHRRRGRSGALRDARDPRTAGCSWSTTRGRPTRSARRSSAARCGSARSPSTDARSASRRHGRNCPPASDRPLTMRPDRHVLAEASTFPVSVRTSSAWISLGRNAVAPVTLE